MPDVFYVYVLFDWRGLPFYVGKGKGRRWLDHERYTDPINWRKNEMVERTWNVIEEIPKIKVRENLTELQAFEIEMVLIDAIGRIDLGTGPLVNMTAGGEGVAGHRQFIPGSPEHSAWRDAISKGHLKYSPEVRSARARQNQAAIKASMTPGEYSALQRRRAFSISPEKRLEVARIASAAVERTSWINDGKTNKRIKPGSEIPLGWQSGRLYTPSEALIKYASSSSWITDGAETRRLGLGDCIPDGWKLGRKLSITKFCLCGCGQKIRNRSTYYRGHYPRIK